MIASAIIHPSAYIERRKKAPAEGPLAWRKTALPEDGH